VDTSAIAYRVAEFLKQHPPFSSMEEPDLLEFAGLASRALWMGLLGLGGALIAWRATLAIALLRRLNPFLPLMVALALASIAWSIDPSLSTRRVYRLVTILVVCIAFVLSGWHARRCQDVVRPALTLRSRSVCSALSAPR